VNIIEKISHDNLYEVKLYKEGVFWVAYEQSAYHIWQQKGYKATKKMVKTLGQEIVSVGFPQSSYETLKNTVTSILEKDDPYFKIFSLDKAIDMEAFRLWKTNLPPAGERISPKLGKTGTGNSPDIFELYIPDEPEMEELSKKDEICRKLRDFPLENKTPMECMNFLSELKKIFYL
jgi:hypothetical protein